MYASVHSLALNEGIDSHFFENLFFLTNVTVDFESHKFVHHS